MFRIKTVAVNIKRLLILNKEQIHSLFFEMFHPLRNDEWGFICPGAMGDTYFICGLGESVLKVHGGKSITVFVKPQQLFIPKLFPDIGRVIPIKKDFNTYLPRHDEVAKGKVFYAHCPSGASISLLGVKSVTLLDYYRALLQLPADAKFSRPLPPDREEHKTAHGWFKSRGLPIGKTVILAPEANHSPVLPQSFWVKLSSQLHKKGWTPVTNTMDIRKVVPGTTIFDVPLQFLRASAEIAGKVIAVRSGLCDLLSATQASMTVLYPKTRSFSWRIFEAGSLQAMGLSSGITELEVEDSNSNEIIEKIVN
jgi:hypothetical protein